jgi:acyl-CoA synthetase (AMP-forming)/AMP-acid ligase II
MLVKDFLRKGAKLYPDRIFMEFQGEIITYRSLYERVNRMANALWERFGVRPGDRIAVLSRNHPAFVEIYLACGQIGAVTVPLNYRLHPNDYRYILNDSEAKILLIETEFLERVRDSTSYLEHLKHLVVIGETEEAPMYEKVIQEFKPIEPDTSVDEEDVWIQMYTSGTKGFPKGAMLTHRNVIRTVLGLVVDVRFNVEPCRILVVAPIFHIGGLITIFSALVIGAACHLKREFYPPEVLRGMSEEGCTHSFMVPVMVRALLAVPDVEARDYSSFRTLMYGAAPMPLPLIQRAREIFQCELIQGYGLTETTGVLGLLLDRDHLVRPTATCREYCMAELRVVNPQGEPVKPGEVGEIVARGEGIMKGYWKLERETRDAFLNGWLRTGDLATVDEEGYITIVDRLKDMIIKGGENIYPGEIERVLLTHPAVQEVAVIGVPDEKWGEEVMALVVPKPGQTLTERDIQRFCRENLASLKRPKMIEIRDRLPSSPSGEVLKRVIREEFWKGYDKRVH